MTEREIAHNKQRGKEVEVVCGTCNRSTYHTVEYSISVTGDSGDITAS